MKAVLIEDEKAAVRNLRALLGEVAPQVEVIAELDSIRDSVAWLGAQGMPEVVFMDIHLADGSAFEIFEHVRITCPIIFTTAYDEYALRAFKVNSVDYLLKPIGPEELRQALDKLILLQGQAPADDRFGALIRTLQNRTRYKTHFLIPGKGDKLLPLSVEQVQYFYIADGIVRAVLSAAESRMLPYTLDELAESLDPDLFFRINRQYLVSRGAIQDIDLWFNNRLAVNLKISTGEKVVVSRLRVNEFKAWFSGQ